ncbi:hypothetical protein DH2020_015724 [Rehmannia glutinosa]|uniref:NAC domain-containing protein n=1 Tax=Rehmannia glutinosa TaxID=99300 RepID=A0ABR0WWR9_REHGL
MKGGDQQLNLPAGFRFHPTDDELVAHYLCRKCAGHQIAAPIIAEIDLYKFDPWDLPGMALYGEKEWYFFLQETENIPTVHGRTGRREPDTGRQPEPISRWGSPRLWASKSSAGKSNNLRLDDWVLCRIYNKKGTLEKHYNVDHKEVQFSDSEEQKPNVDSLLPYDGIVTPAPMATQTFTSQRMNDYMHFDASDSLPKLHTDSSSSEHVLSPSDKEVQSEPKWSEFENSLDFQLNYIDAFQDDPFTSQMQYNYQLSMFQDMFGYMHKPF